MNELDPYEVYKENVYTRMEPGHLMKCVSVSEEGFVAFADKANCKVLNPYLNVSYCLRSESKEGNGEEEGKTAGKKVFKSLSVDS